MLLVLPASHLYFFQSLQIIKRMQKTFDVRFIVLLLIILLVGALRLLSDGGMLASWLNFTPIGAMALFGGAYFSHKGKAYLFPLLTLLVSDLVLMQTVYQKWSNGWLYSGWYWTYGAFFVMVLLGQTVLKKVNITNVVLGAFLSALAHYIITDLGVWLGGGLDLTTGKPYTRDLAGFVNCYLLALPYFQKMLLSTLLYSGLLFGGFELMQKRFPVLAKHQVA